MHSFHNSIIHLIPFFLSSCLAVTDPAAQAPTATTEIDNTITAISAFSSQFTHTYTFHVPFSLLGLEIYVTPITIPITIGVDAISPNSAITPQAPEPSPSGLAKRNSEASRPSIGYSEGSKQTQDMELRIIEKKNGRGVQIRQKRSSEIEHSNYTIVSPFQNGCMSCSFHFTFANDGT